MTLQNIRRFYEEPVIAAATALGIPVRAENQLDSSGDAASEFLVTRLTFGRMSEPTTCGSIEVVRGSFIVEYFGPKGTGPARAQTVLLDVSRALHSLTTRPAPRTSYGVTGTILTINGPSFTALADQPYYFGTLSAPIIASYQAP